jgi:hypothetical protein
MATQDALNPDPRRERFRCLHCGTVTYQTAPLVKFVSKRGTTGNPRFRARQCDECFRLTVWVERADYSISPIGSGPFLLVFPLSAGPKPHSEMPQRALAVYEEARLIAERSPRGAAALLRLALQTLVDELVPGTASLDAKIAKLVRRGLSAQVQRAMDILRITGNNAVHPGQIEFAENPKLVPEMFSLLNLVVEQMIVRQERIDLLYRSMPEEARRRIERRDAETSGGNEE